MNNFKSKAALYWSLAGILALALVFVLALIPDNLWASGGVGALLILSLGGLINFYWTSLKSRTTAFGVNSFITAALVISIVGVLNFLMSKQSWKLDLTKEKKHTLSDQTVKLIKDLKKPVKVVLFAKMNQKEEFRALLENYKGLNPTKFDIEYTDPDKEPARAKQLNIKKFGTLYVSVINDVKPASKDKTPDGKEIEVPSQAITKDTRIEEVTEEKLTNALIKLLKQKTQILCAITGHGEKSFDSKEADGLSTMKQGLLDQAYEVREVNLTQEGKIPEACDAISIMGPNKAFFEQEIKLIDAYLTAGGHAVIALDLELKGQDLSVELLKLLEKWYVKVYPALIVDPLSRMFGVDASVPIIPTFSKTNAITKDFEGQCYFPFTRPLEVMTGAPATLKVEWIAQTTPKSWGEFDLKELGQGRVSYAEGKDKIGPLTVAIAIDGKPTDSKSEKSTRIVVFGSSQVGSNNYSRFGGNSDLFLNSVSWTMEDDSLISIRGKDAEAGKVELSRNSGRVIFLLTVIVIPLLVAISGIVIWVFRRRL